MGSFSATPDKFENVVQILNREWKKYAAEGATLPQKQADGTIKWVAISAIVEGDGNTKSVGKAADSHQL